MDLLQCTYLYSNWAQVNVHNEVRRVTELENFKKTNFYDVLLQTPPWWPSTMCTENEKAWKPQLKGMDDAMQFCAA